MQTSADETRKWLFRLRDGQEVETVYIPDRHATAARSASARQVGCTLSCRFCHTGTQKLVRNLGAAEIVGQFMAARDSYGEWPSPKDDQPRLLSTIVVMGMGEPLYNYENTAKALRDHHGRRGHRPVAPAHHAVHHRRRADDGPLRRGAGGQPGGVAARGDRRAAQRDRAAEPQYPIEELLDACRRYPGASNARRITFEYVMLRGVNDCEAEARELVRLLHGLPAKINLIPFNPWPGSALPDQHLRADARFAAILNDAGYSSPIRRPRGRDILAACGQLKTESERERKAVA